VLDGVFQAGLVKEMVPRGLTFTRCGESVGKDFIVIGQHLADLKGGLGDQALYKENEALQRVVLE